MLSCQRIMVKRTHFPSPHWEADLGFEIVKEIPRHTTMQQALVRYTL